MAVQRTSGKGRLLAGVKRGGGKMHIGMYPLSGGKLGSKTSGAPVVLLTTTGRKSGLSRTVALVHLQKDGAVVLSASNAGHWKPAWFLNIRDNPEVTVEIGRRKFTATARIAEGSERAELWAHIVSLNSNFENYRVSLDYEIPMVVIPIPQGA